MENVLLVIIDQHATEEAKKKCGDDDEGSKNLLNSVSFIYDRLMICYYSLKNKEKSQGKLQRLIQIM